MKKPGKNAQSGAKAAKAKPVAAVAKTPVKPHRYDRRSVKQYEDEGMKQAVDFFSESGSHFRMDVVKPSQVREAIDRLPASKKLQAAMADFWLGLTKAEGRWRRNNNPPPSPFVKAGRTLVAGKEQIEDWDRDWRAVEAARVYAKSGSAKVRSIGELIRTSLPWLTDKAGAVIGNVAELPIAKFEQAMMQPENLGVKWMTVERALQSRWLYVEEQQIWLSRFKSATQALMAELERNYLERAVEKTGSDKASPDKTSPRL